MPQDAVGGFLNLWPDLKGIAGRQFPHLAPEAVEANPAEVRPPKFDFLTFLCYCYLHDRSHRAQPGSTSTSSHA
ncbi:hypothetical protein BH23PAT1_BH23PAT1_3040 [soil metagenome]